MRRDPVVSSNLVSVGYDSQSGTLEVEFQNGTVYQYFNVPQSTYEAFMAAPSKGQFFAYQIRDRFPYGRV